jgi:uncharacterized membrane protein YdjX (TVP38/TMEM64 family)
MRLVIWFVGLSLAILGGWLAWGGDWEARFSFEGTVEALGRSGGWAWAAGIGLLVADVLLPVPGTVVMSALGFVYGPLLGGLAASAGSTAAGLAAYGLCRALGERGARRILGDLDFERGKLLFAKGGGWAVAMSRALPILPEAIACTAGLVRMPFRRFVGALLCGSLPMGFLFAAIGHAGRGQPGWALAFSLAVPALLWGLSRVAARRFEG